MMRHTNRLVVVVVTFTVALPFLLARQASAVGEFYLDPGWTLAYDGATAFYNDPDGPNPDYINNGTNNPGGQSNTAALISAPNETAPWLHHRQQWDGTAPGAPLGGTPGSPPPIPPHAPGGVASYADGATSYLRIQDTGQPQGYGWTDKNASDPPAVPARQEGNNRLIMFKHPLDRDVGVFSGNHAVLDNGITISFRTRIATAATGPLDAIFPEGGSSPIPWPATGLGYPIHGTGRGIFMISQQAPTGGQQLSFGLVNSNTITEAGLPTTRTGLVMNNRFGVGSVDTNLSNAATLNMYDLTDVELNEWQEFWITIKKLTSPIDGNTHEVNVYHNGLLVPETFQVVMGIQNEFGATAHLGMGFSSGTRAGAVDIDYYAYKEGVILPTLAPMGVPGDYNDDGTANLADYVAWRKAGAPLENDATPGHGPEDYTRWVTNFGDSDSGSGGGAVPEPASALMLLAICGLSALRHSRQRCLVR